MISSVVDSLTHQLCIVILLYGYNIPAWSQTQRIEVRNADQLTIENRPEGPIRLLVGNVLLAQDTMTMACDSAILDPGRNYVEAHRRVVISTSRRIRLSGSRLEYDGQQRVARLFDNIRLEQDSVRLLTNVLIYDRNTREGRYTGGGQLIDPRNTLSSRTGTYYASNRSALFEDSVRLTNPRYVLNTQRLRYLTETKTAYFVAPTYIRTKDARNLYTDGGWFDTRLNRTLLYPRPWYRDSIYFLRADTLFYDDSLKVGRAYCGLEMYNVDSSLQVRADNGTFFNNSREVWMTDHPYLIQQSKRDTMLLIADTLYVLDDSIGNRRVLQGMGKCRIHLRRLQARADSILYNRIDSTLQLFKDPVIWSGLNQLSGDTIRIWMVNQTVDSLIADGRAWVIARNDSAFDDQVKGRLLRAKFKDSQILRLYIDGNSESLYLVKEEGRRIGLNEAQCKSLKVYLSDNEPEKLLFIDEPEARFRPLHEVWGQRIELEGYRWRISERPRDYLRD